MRDDDSDDDGDSDGTPQPATQPMSREEALALAARTDGQLVAFLHHDGQWYCFHARPSTVGVEPKIRIVP